MQDGPPNSGSTRGEHGAFAPAPRQTIGGSACHLSLTPPIRRGKPLKGKRGGRKSAILGHFLKIYLPPW